MSRLLINSVVILITILSALGQSKKKNNAVKNSGFENSKHSWTLSNGAIQNNEIHNGSFSLKISQDHPSWSLAVQYIKLPQDVKRIFVSGWIKTDSIIQGKKDYEKAIIGVQLLDSSNSLVNGYSPTVGQMTGTSEWTYYSNNYEVTPEISKLKLIAGLSNCSGTIFIDDLEVYFFDYNNDPIAPLEKKITLTIGEQQQDLLELKDYLNSIHPSLYRCTTKERMDSIFKSIQEKITKDQSITLFSEHLLPLFNEINDGHTWMNYDNEKEQMQIPLDVMIIKNKVYVKNNFSSNKRIKKGQTIKSIQGIPSEEILKKMFAKFPSDGGVHTMKNRAIEEYFRHFYDVEEGVSELNLVIEENSQTLDLNIELLKPKAIDSIRASQGASSSDKRNATFFDFIKKDSYAILTITNFEKIPWIEYKILLDNAINELNDTGVQNLIIDLRWNTGGPRKYPIYLFSKITNSNFNFCKSLITKQATLDANLTMDTNKVFTPLKNGLYQVINGAIGLGLQQCHPANFQGNVYLLIDGMTFSSGSNFAAIFKSNKRGVIIGEESGGFYFGGTGEHHFTTNLRNSEIFISIPRYRLVLAVDHEKVDVNRGVIPDYIIESTIYDRLNNKDSSLEKTLMLIQK